MERNAMVLLSGGQDSTTVLYSAKSQCDVVHALSIYYGQRHSIEIEAAKRVAAMAKVASHEVVVLPDDILRSTSPLVSSSTLEQYSGWEVLPGGIEKTFVPLRNALFLTIAANRAVSLGCASVYIGVSEEDYGGYPDCRETFIIAFTNLLELALQGAYGDLDICTPLLFKSKKQTVELAMKLPGCMEALAYTHTAYDGQYPPLGNDHATLLRAKGFEQAGIPDPLIVRAWREGLMLLPPSFNYDGLRYNFERV